MTVLHHPEILEEAADLLEEVGHTKGDYCKGGRRCALGALVEVGARHIGCREPWIPSEDAVASEFQPDVKSYEFIKPYADALAVTVGMGSSWDIPDWNDNPKRTRKQVVAAMRKTAERIRREQW